MAGGVSVAAPHITQHWRADEHRFYAAVGILVLLISLAGFGPSIIEPSNRNDPLPMTPLVTTHALASSVWILLFLVQTTLVATGRAATHRRLGLIGIPVAVVFVISGCLASVGEAARGFDLSGDLATRNAPLEPYFILAPSNAFGLFAVMVGAALWYRRRPDVHKRLMALTMLGPIAGAPVAHLMGHYPMLTAVGGVFGPVSSLLLLSLCAIYDRVSYGRIHPVSLWGGIGAFAWVFGFFTIVAPSAAWRDFSNWLVQ